MKSTPATSGRWTMRREGSPWTGLWAVVLKELADHLSSVRMQLLGKFLAGIVTLGISLLALWLLVTGMGLLVLGVAPSGAEVARGLLFLLSTLAYAGIWLALALVFSVIFRQPATSALAAMAVW